jgi:hypothetical protein
LILPFTSRSPFSLFPQPPSICAAPVLSERSTSTSRQVFRMLCVGKNWLWHPQQLLKKDRSIVSKDTRVYRIEERSTDVKTKTDSLRGNVCLITFYHSHAITLICKNVFHIYCTIHKVPFLDTSANILQSNVTSNMAPRGNKVVYVRTA